MFISYIIYPAPFGVWFIFASDSEYWAWILVKVRQNILHGSLIASGCVHGTNTSKVLKSIGWANLAECRDEKLIILMYGNDNNVQDVRLRQPRPYRLPARMLQSLCRSAVPKSTINYGTHFKIWLQIHYLETPSNRMHIRGAKSDLPTTKLSLPRKFEVTLNRARWDILFRSHYFSHNFVNFPDPVCQCGFRS
jgi:hypothetical protein